MVNEVESILNEIRERVRNDHERGSAPPSPSGRAGEHAAQQTLSPNPSPELRGEIEPAKSESLSRLSAHLTTTARAWDRLPPMSSNRKGRAARLELWIKARIKSLSRWFTWEQVNFNAAVHYALIETLHALSAYQQELNESSKEAESWREKFELSNRELTALRASTEALAAEIRKRDANLNAVMDETRAELASRLAELAGELREREQQQREEQRVCFKQLSLEASEAAVMEDRGRRLIESRLDRLEKSLPKSES